MILNNFTIEPIALLIFVFIYFIYIDKIFIDSSYKKVLYFVASLTGFFIGNVFNLITYFIIYPNEYSANWVGEDLMVWLIMITKSIIVFVISFFYYILNL